MTSPKIVNLRWATTVALNFVRNTLCIAQRLDIETSSRKRKRTVNKLTTAKKKQYMTCELQTMKVEWFERYFRLLVGLFSIYLSFSKNFFLVDMYAKESKFSNFRIHVYQNATNLRKIQFEIFVEKFWIFWINLWIVTGNHLNYLALKKSRLLATKCSFTVCQSLTSRAVYVLTLWLSFTDWSRNEK